MMTQNRPPVEVPAGESPVEQADSPYAVAETEGAILAAAADDVGALLKGYLTALDAAAALPPVVRIASRPRRWWVGDPLRRFPRLTVGTSTMVGYHARRTSAALIRRYGLLEATRGLSDDEQRASGMVRTFNASLPPIRWNFIVPAGLVAAFLVVQIVVAAVGGVVTGALDDFGRRTDLKVVHQLTESLLRWGSTLPTAGSSVDLYTEVGKASLAEWVTLALTVLVAVYFVLRPMAPVFRIKRIIFNLAPAGAVNLHRTTTTWNLTRSTGLYELERRLFAQLGSRPPREIDVDLLIGVVPVAAMAWWVCMGGVVVPETAAAHVFVYGVAVGLVGARFAWLWQTATARRRAAGTTVIPGGYRMTPAVAIAEVRSVLETAALGVASFFLLFVTLFPGVAPSPVWVRLVRERRDLEQGHLAKGSVTDRHSATRNWPAVVSAVLLFVIPPVPLYVHLTGLARLQGPQGTARHTRDWLVPLAAATTAFVVLDVFFLSRVLAGALNGSSFIAAAGIFAAAFATVQREHNRLAQQAGQPLAFDDPQPRRDTSAVTLARRLQAGVIDTLPILILALVALDVVASGCNEPGQCAAPTANGRVVLITVVALAVIYMLWNWGFRLGRTGRSIGKSALGYKLISESTGRPIGFGPSLVRQVVHIAVDLNPLVLFIGSLAALRNIRRQTFADRIASTICVPVAAPEDATAPDDSDGQPLLGSERR